MTTNITSRGAHSFEVSTPAVSGSVEVTPSGYVIYVAQPERPMVIEGSTRFAAADADPAGILSRGRWGASDAAYDTACAVFEAFIADPASTERTRQARQHLVAALRADRAKSRDWVAAERAKLDSYIAFLDAADLELDEAAADPAVPLPAFDAHLMHPALWSSRRG